MRDLASVDTPEPDHKELAPADDLQLIDTTVLSSGVVLTYRPQA
ncbi:hypothetical protein BH20ACT16_BH20ACT16_09740 [soil metagenome]